jgi:hypothetical protein
MASLRMGKTSKSLSRRGPGRNPASRVARRVYLGTFRAALEPENQHARRMQTQRAY